MTSPRRPEEFEEFDASSFRALVREHTGSVLRWVHRYANGPDEAEDLVQEVWHRVVVKGRGQRATGSFRGWLYTVTRNVCIDAVRSEATRRRAETAAALESVNASRNVDGPASLVLDSAGEVRDALESLPPRQLETVTLRVLDGLTTRETAEVMECSPGTVKASLSQGLVNLKRRLEGDRP